MLKHKGHLGHKELISLKLKPYDIISFGNFCLVLLHHYESHAGDDQRFLLQLERVGHVQDSPRALLWVTTGYEIIMQPGRTTQWTFWFFRGSVTSMFFRPTGPVQFTMEFVLKFLRFKNRQVAQRGR